MPLKLSILLRLLKITMLPRLPRFQLKNLPLLLGSPLNMHWISLKRKRKCSENGR
jgi:hypothetical protein